MTKGWEVYAKGWGVNDIDRDSAWLDHYHAIMDKFHLNTVVVDACRPCIATVTVSSMHSNCDCVHPPARGQGEQSNETACAELLRSHQKALAAGTVQPC